MMNIAMAKVVVGLVGASGAVRPGCDADDAELAQAGLAEAGAWSPMGWVRVRLQRMRDRIAPATGATTADVALAATAIAMAQGVMPSQTVPAAGLTPERATITDSVSVV